MADLSKHPIEIITIGSTHPDDLVSQNFYIRDLTRSELASRLNIPNWFQTDFELRNAVRVCREVLQPVRDRFWPFTPNSVYRSQALERRLKNKSAKWRSTSQHTRGEAADIEISGLSNLELARWIHEHLTYDQLILEYYDPAQGVNSGWVHVSLISAASPCVAAVNRREVLSFDGKAYRVLTSI